MVGVVPVGAPAPPALPAGTAELAPTCETGPDLAVAPVAPAAPARGAAIASIGAATARTRAPAMRPAARGRQRQRSRALEPDRLELEEEAFFARIALAYEELAEAEPQRICVLDGSLPAEEVLREALAAIDDLLG